MLNRAKYVSEAGSNYPPGAENDPRAPWNEKEPHLNKPTRPKSKEYKALWKDDEIILLADEAGAKWVFYHGDVPKDELAEFAEVPLEVDFDEDGANWGFNRDFLSEWSPELEDIESAINYWGDSFVKGEGLNDWESGEEFVKVDEELAEELERLHEVPRELLR